MSEVIAITGASGFIGRYLVEHLLSCGYDVRVLGRDRGAFEQIATPVEVFETTYRDDGLLDALAGCHALIHLAGRRLTHEDDPSAVAPFASSNLANLDAILSAAKACHLSKIINMSSIGVYSQDMPVPWSEDDAALPATPYGVGKLCAEKAADFWKRKTEIPVIHFRLAQCFGLGERETGVLMKFVARAQKKEPLMVTNGGNFKLDQVYIADVVRAFECALKTHTQGAFNIGAGQSFSVLDIARAVNAAFNNDGNLSIEGEATGESPNRHMSLEKARTILSWRPNYTLDRALGHMASLSRA